jgi:hypothetical protein
MSSPVVVRSVRGRHDRTSLCDQVRRGRGPAGRRRTGVGSRSPRSRISRDSSTTTPLALDPVVGPGFYGELVRFGKVLSWRPQPAALPAV